MPGLLLIDTGDGLNFALGAEPDEVLADGRSAVYVPDVLLAMDTHRAGHDLLHRLIQDCGIEPVRRDRDAGRWVFARLDGRAFPSAEEAEAEMALRSHLARDHDGGCGEGCVTAMELEAALRQRAGTDE